MLDASGLNSEIIQNKAKELLNLSEIVIQSAQFRLPQCNDYLKKHCY